MRLRVLGQILLLVMISDKSLWAEDASDCRSFIINSLKDPVGPSDLLERSKLFFGTGFDSARGESGDIFLKSFPSAVSFTNESEVWEAIRDRAITISQTYPERFVVSTGLQQSLELVFAGAPKIVMVDAYGPNISTFVLFAKLSQTYESLESFLVEAAKHLVVLRGTGAGPSSYLDGARSIRDFLKIFEGYGEEGYRRWRSASRSGGLRAYLQDAGVPEWGISMRQLTNQQAPSVIYTSNIIDWLSPHQLLPYAESIRHLSADHEPQGIVRDLFRPPSIVFSSWIAQTSAGFKSFTWESGALSDLKRGPTSQLHTEASRWLSYESISQATRPPLDSIEPLDSHYVLVRNNLTGLETVEGLLRIDQSKVYLITPSGRKYELSYHPSLHSLRIHRPPLRLAEILQLRGHHALIRTRRTNEVSEIEFKRPLDFKPEGGSFSVNWDAQSAWGSDMEFTYSDRSHEILQILSYRE